MKSLTTFLILLVCGIASFSGTSYGAAVGNKLENATEAIKTQAALKSDAPAKAEAPRNNKSTDTDKAVPADVATLNAETKAGVRSAETKKVSKSNPPKRRMDEGNCFTDCLLENLNPEVVAECASNCANKQYVNCAICLGVGVYIVISCGNRCYLLD